MSGTLRLRGSTSGYAELQAAAVAGDQTFILPAVGGTLLTTDSPVGNLTLELGSASQPSLRFEGDTDTGLFSSGANTLNLVTGGSNKLVLGATAHTIFSGTNGSVRAVDIDSSGRVLIGTSSAVDSGATSSIQVVNTSTAILALGRNDSSISVGNDLGAIRFYGNDGGSYQMCAEVIAEADGDHANDDKPTRLVFSTTADGGSSPTPRMTIKSNGSALIGTETSNANDRLTIIDPGDSLVSIRSSAAADATSQILDFAVGTGDRASTNLTGTIQAVIHSQSGGTLKSDLKFHTNAGNNITQRMVIKDTGYVGIGAFSSTDPQATLHCLGTTNGAQAIFGTSSSGLKISTFQKTDNDAGVILDAQQASNGTLTFATGGNEAARIDSSLRLIVGRTSAVTSGSAADSIVQIVGKSGSPTDLGQLTIARGNTAANLGSGAEIGEIIFSDNAGGKFAQIQCNTDGTTGGVNGNPGRLTFYTEQQGSDSGPVERLRITKAGDVTTTGTSSFSRTNAGFTARKDDSVSITRNGGTPLEVNRGTNDGNLVNFFGQNVAQGTITVNGSTVSYNGGHLARWSQLASGSERIEILRGSVLSNLNEMCEWGDEDNEQLNRMKISDVEGDRNVAGVFQAWDDDDDIYINDFYCAMTGDFVIRIGKNVTVERGDLLMSAGDGTAKPQDDDIIRSKTIAKVTSTHVSETYADGSYCVPCVLMAC